MSEGKRYWGYTDEAPVRVTSRDISDRVARLSRLFVKSMTKKF